MSASDTPIYARRDIEDLCEYYTRHLDAMTRENLHSKSDIAAELAWRDRKLAATELLAEAMAALIERAEHAAWKAIPDLDRLHQAKMRGCTGQLITGHPHSETLAELATEMRDALSAWGKRGEG